MPEEFDAEVDIIVAPTLLEPIIRMDQRPPQELDVERPVPYVIEFTPSGRMKIGWTNKMMAPGDEVEKRIKPSRVSVNRETDI